MVLYSIFLLFAELPPFKSGKNKGMGHLQRFEYIEDHLIKLNTDYRQNKKLMIQIKEKNKKMETLEKTLDKLQEQVSRLNTKMDQINGNQFKKLEKKVNRIDNRKLQRIHIKLRGMNSRINSLEQTP